MKLTRLYPGISMVLLFAGLASACVPLPLTPNPGSAVTVYVDASNVSGPWDGSSAHPYAKITDGIGAAATGDVVHVAAGVYSENIRMKSGVNVAGVGAAKSQIIGQADVNGVVAFSDVTNTRLSGFTISVASPVSGVDRSVVFAGTTDSTAILERCVIRSTQYGIFVWPPATPIIQNNTLAGPGEQGIYIGNSPTAPTIRNNIITGYFSAGIHVVGGGTPAPLIAYNDVWQNGSNYMGWADQTGLNGNIAADPLFASPPDCHLKKGSPCINSGDPVSPSDPDGTRADIGAFAGMPQGSALYVWRDPKRHGTPIVLAEAHRLADFATSRAIDTVFYDNYGCGPVTSPSPACPTGAEQQAAQDLTPILQVLHSHGLKVEALYTDNTRISNVVTYNQSAPPDARFDAIRLDIETFSLGKAPTQTPDIQLYADAVTQAGALPIHASMGHTWDALVVWQGVEKPAYKHIQDIVAGVDIQTAQDTAAPIVAVSTDELCYAKSLGKPIYVTIESADVVTYDGLNPFNTFYEEGESKMWEVLSQVSQAAPNCGGTGPVQISYAFHFYRQSLGSSTITGWQAD